MAGYTSYGDASSFRNTRDALLQAPVYQQTHFNKVKVLLFAWDPPQWILRGPPGAQTWFNMSDQWKYTTGKMYQVLHQDYQFDVSIKYITAEGDDFVRREVLQLIGNDDPSVLKIVHYNGHGMIKDGVLHWACDNTSVQSPVIWGGQNGIQLLLEQARSPGIIFLDCCVATSVNLKPDKSNTYLPRAGTTWQMAAASYNASSWSGPNCLTEVLTRQLAAAKLVPDGVSLYKLHSKITFELSRLPAHELQYTQAPILTCLTYNEAGSQELSLKSGHYTQLQAIPQSIENVLLMAKKSVGNIPKFAAWVNLWSPKLHLWAPMIAIIDTGMNMGGLIEESRFNMLFLAESKREVPLSEGPITADGKRLIMEKAKLMIRPDWAASLPPASTGQAYSTDTIEVDTWVSSSSSINDIYDLVLGMQYWSLLMDSISLDDEGVYLD